MRMKCLIKPVTGYQTNKATNIKLAPFGRTFIMGAIQKSDKIYYHLGVLVPLWLNYYERTMDSEVMKGNNGNNTYKT